MRKNAFLMLIALFLAPDFSAKAQENQVQARIRELEKLVPLEKITVGPDDQFNGDILPGGRVLVFTEKSGLISGIRLQDLTTGETTALLPSNADADEAVAGPDGRIAFTYFKFNARGDICYVRPPQPPFHGKTAKDNEVRCLMRAESSVQRSHPFWVSANVLGYVERDFDGRSARIVSENLSSGERTVLAEGRVWSPFMRSGGRYLVYLDWAGEQARAGSGRSRRIVVKDLESGESQIARFALPGFSAFPTVSPDEEYLYFSHFLNDTNEDQTIDGADNGVIFRLPLKKVFKAGELSKGVLPEQLTSVETSCGFPRVAVDRLVITCAFEGSLDVYNAPVNGIVPEKWDEKRILNAIDTSRSYQDRILFLNALQYRFRGGVATGAYFERMLSEHILADDVSAALFYLNQGARDSDIPFYSLLEAYLKARELKNSQPPGELSREFRAAIADLEKRVSKVKQGKGIRKELFLAHLKWSLGDVGAAKALLNRVDWRGAVRPLERYLHFGLARSLYAGKRGADFQALQKAYRVLLTAPELDAQSRLYYAFYFLKDTHSVSPSPEERIKVIGEMWKTNPANEIVVLFQAEIASLRMTSASDENAKTKAFGELSKLFSETRDNYFVRRALYTRVVVNFTEAAEVKYLGVVARNWLRFTVPGDTEFAYAREAFADNSLSQAYLHLDRGEWLLADNYFYESLSFTDDLESHYGFIRARLEQGRRADLLRDYEDLSRRKLVTDNLKFVEAVIDIFDDASGNDDRLDRAIGKLEAIVDGRDSAMRYLALGYAYMEKLFRTARGLDFDSKYLQKAHRSLLLAYDLAWDNPRIRASALMNLGILHQRVQNHGQAVRFFSLRKTYGFISDDEKARFEFLYARSLAYAHQPDLAASELGSIAENSRATPFEERRAFYLATAGEFKEAEAIYSRLLSERRITGDVNLAKANLAYGYVLLKLGREAEARGRLLTALKFSEKLRPLKASKERLVDFEPLRIEIVGYGLLAQTGSPEDRLSALRARLDRLEKSRNLVANWMEARIQIHNQIAEIESVRGESARAAEEMREALRLTSEFGETGQYIGKLVYRTAANFLAHAVLYPDVYKQDDVERVSGFVDNCIAAYEAQKVSDPVLDMQNLKLRILLEGMRAKILKVPAKPGEHLRSSVGTRLKAERPDLFHQVSTLAAALE